MHRKLTTQFRVTVFTRKRYITKKNNEKSVIWKRICPCWNEKYCKKWYFLFQNRKYNIQNGIKHVLKRHSGICKIFWQANIFSKKLALLKMENHYRYNCIFKLIWINWTSKLTQMKTNQDSEYHIIYKVTLYWINQTRHLPSMFCGFSSTFPNSHSTLNGKLIRPLSWM